MFLLYHSERYNTSGTVFHWCYIRLAYYTMQWYAGSPHFRCKERTPGNLHLVLAVFAIVVVVFARVVDVVVSATGWVIEHTCAYVAIAFVAADIWPRGCECGQTFWSQRRGTPYLAHQTSPWQTTGRQIIISQPLAVSIHGISYSLYII
jgi:hypothetical protein